jgi:predicted nuclease of predicted toxin-antitoxin system
LWWVAEVKVLLDECVDARFAREIVGHQVQTVPQAGWAGLPDSEILKNAERGFDVLVTTDSNLEFQQNLANYDVAVIVLRAPTNRLVDLKPIIPQLLALLPTAPKRQATRLRA